MIIISQTILRPTNYQLGEARITVLGQNKTTGGVAIYSAQFTPNEGTNFPIGTLRSTSKAKSWHYNHDGTRASPTFQNEEVKDSALSLTYIDDAFYWGTRVCINVDKSVLTAMMNGEVFKDSTDTIKVVGTNGTAMTNPVVTGNDYTYLFSNMGKSTLPSTDDGTGKPVKITNADILAYNPFGLTVMIEMFTTVDSSTKQGYRFVYCSKKTTSATENGDSNTRTIEFDCYSDTLSIDNFFVDGVTDKSTVNASLTTGTIDGVEVDYAIGVAGGTAPTFTGATTVSSCAVVNTTTGALDIYYTVNGGTAWTKMNATPSFNQGAIIRAKVTGTTANTLPSTAGVKFLAVKTAGGTGSAILAKENSTTPTYMFPVKNLDLTGSTAVFAIYA